MTETEAIDLDLLESPPPEPALDSSDPPELDPTSARRFVITIFLMLIYMGFTVAVNGIGAPFIARTFKLNQSGIAGLYAWISLSALGSMALSRMADRIGRRRILLACMIGIPLSSLGAAVSTLPAEFAVFEILTYVFTGAMLATAIVMMAEELPVHERARGQSIAGLGVMLGGGVCLIVMPIVADTALSWRWALLGSAGGLLAFPVVARLIPESQRWLRAEARGINQSVGFLDVFEPTYRKRAIVTMVFTVIALTATTACQSWSYFHIVSVVGLPASVASLVMFLGGGVSILGFILGAKMSERFGRVPTVVGFGIMASIGGAAFYWGPPAFISYKAVWLSACFAIYMIAFNGGQVGSNSAATELFPTALRGTMMGWFTLLTAVGATLAQAGIAILATRLGGLSNVAGLFALLTIPGVIIFGLFIDETRGLTLEAASREAA